MASTCHCTNIPVGAALRGSNCLCAAPMHLNVPRARALSSSAVFPRLPPAPAAARPRPTRQAHAATAVTRADLAPAPSTDRWRVVGGGSTIGENRNEGGSRRFGSGTTAHAGRRSGIDAGETAHTSRSLGVDAGDSAHASRDDWYRRRNDCSRRRDDGCRHPDDRSHRQVTGVGTRGLQGCRDASAPEP